ncbi:hypothetical protein PFISCL1PPCAC_24393, partial [Pristionchus fissidentatus]
SSVYRMHFSLHPTSNLKKLQDLPATSHWVKNDSVWIYGDIVLYTRHHGIIDKVSSECRRPVVLTKNGDFIVYMKEKKGFVLDLHSSTEVLSRTAKARLKTSNTVINRCKMKMRFKFGTVNATFYGEEVEKWRNGICDVLDGKAVHPTLERVSPAPVEVDIEEELIEKEEIYAGDVSSLYENTSDVEEHVITRAETYTVVSKKEPTEQSMKSEVVPHSELLSDAPTPPMIDSVIEEEPTPVASQPYATFPPHRTANIGFIHPHPPRNLVSFVPPSDGPPKPPRLSLSKIPVVVPPSPAPRRSKTKSTESSPMADRPVRKISRAETFKSDVSSNDSFDSRMPYYKGRVQYVQRTPKEKSGTVTTRTSIELTPRSEKKAFSRLPIPEAFMEKKKSEETEGNAEMCAHLEVSVGNYIKDIHAQTLKDSKEMSPRTESMENKIAIFEQAFDTVPQANRSSTMPRRLSRIATNGPATLPRSTSSAHSRKYILDADFKESAV